jgi:hypothetical protein
MGNDYMTIMGVWGWGKRIFAWNGEWDRCICLLWLWRYWAICLVEEIVHTSARGAELDLYHTPSVAYFLYDTEVLYKGM